MPTRPRRRRTDANVLAQVPYLPFAEWHEVQPVLELLGEIGYSERDVRSALEYLGAEFELDLQGQEWALIKYGREVYAAEGSRVLLTPSGHECRAVAK